MDTVTYPVPSGANISEEDCETFHHFATRVYNNVKGALTQSACAQMGHHLRDTLVAFGGETRVLRALLVDNTMEFPMFSSEWFGRLDNSSVEYRGIRAAFERHFEQVSDQLDIIDVLRGEDNPHEEASRYAEDTADMERILSYENVFREMCFLRAQFGERVCFLTDEDLAIDYGPPQSGRWRIALRTDAISFEEDGVDVDFAGFFLILDVDELTGAVAGNDYARALYCHAVGDPNYAEGTDTIHPHVQGSAICAGEGGQPIVNALSQGLISDAFSVGESILNTYNPSGPFTAIRYWYGERDFCSICEESLDADEEPVTVEPHGDIAHETCAEYDEEHNCYFNPHRIFHCPICHQPTRDHHRISDFGRTMCRGCHSLLHEEFEAAKEGVYICPHCRARHEGEDVLDNRFIYGPDFRGCPNCTELRTMTDGSEQARHLLESEWHDRHPSTVTLHASRPVPDIAVLTNCSCGACHAELQIKLDETIRQTFCPTCDPNGLGVHPTLMESPPHMDFWFRQRFLSFTDEFTRRFLDMASFCDMQAPQTAFTLLLRRFRGGNFSAPPQGATALLAEKAAWWNQIIEDTNQSLVIYTEEQADGHDQEIIFQWRVHAGHDSHAARRLRLYEEQQAQGAEDAPAEAGREDREGGSAGENTGAGPW